MSGRLGIADVYSVNTPPGYSLSGERSDHDPVIPVNLPSFVKCVGVLALGSAICELSYLYYPSL